MTYNFDPDKWHEDQLLQLSARLEKGEISRDQYNEAVLALELKLEQMWKRLDGTYRVEGGGGACG